jgi:hypothetical protein
MIAVVRICEVGMSVPVASLLQTQDVGGALVRMSPEQLAEVYAGGETAAIPHGRARGVAVLFPRTGLAPALAKVGWFVWQGKIFNATTGTLVNQVIGLHLIPAKLYHGPSWFDDGDAVIIDYKDTSLSFSRIRDEIRLIAPDFWLGRSYYRRGEKGSYVLSFGLDFRA